jgi:Family of unknown function (DUF6804)
MVGLTGKPNRVTFDCETAGKRSDFFPGKFLYCPLGLPLGSEVLASSRCLIPVRPFGCFPTVSEFGFASAYGYYTFTTIVICGSAAFIAFIGWEDSQTARVWSVLFVLMAILFNPIFPDLPQTWDMVHLDLALLLFLPPI